MEHFEKIHKVKARLLQARLDHGRGLQDDLAGIPDKDQSHRDSETQQAMKARFERRRRDVINDGASSS